MKRRLWAFALATVMVLTLSAESCGESARCPEGQHSEYSDKAGKYICVKDRARKGIVRD